MTKISGCKDIAKRITEATGVPCSERTVQRFIAQEKLPAKRWGNTVTVEEGALMSWIGARWR